MSEDYQFDPEHRDVGKHVTTGVLSSGLSQIVKILCQFGSIIILSRLLAPSDFGLVAMASPIYGFVCLFQGLGLNQATIQKAKISHGEVNALFWINVAVGLALSCILFLLSPLIGHYYGDPRVISLTMAMSLLVIISAIGNQHGSILYRRMEFGKSALIDILGTVGSLFISIGWAYFVGGYWAIYAGMVASILIPVMGVWIATGWMPGPPKLVAGLKTMLKFGAHMTGANIAYFISGNIDNILIGRYYGDEVLGLYDRAYKLLLFPLQRVVFPLGSIMIPVLSRLHEDEERYRRAFFKTVAPLTLAAWPGIIWAIVLANTLIPFALGVKFADSAPLFQPLAIAGLFGISNIPLFWLLVSQGRPKEYAYFSYFTAGTTIVAIAIGLKYGPIGVSISLALAEILRTPFYWGYITRKGPVKLTDMISNLLPQIAGAITALIALIVYQHLIHIMPLVFLAAGLILSYAICLLTMLPFSKGRETLKHSVAVAYRIFGDVFSSKNKMS